MGSHIHCPDPAEKAPGTAAVLLSSSSSLFPPGHPSAHGELAFHAISYKSLGGQGGGESLVRVMGWGDRTALRESAPSF